MSVLKYSFILMLVCSAFIKTSHAAINNARLLNTQQNSYAQQLITEALKQSSSEQSISVLPGAQNLKELDSLKADIVWTAAQSINANTDHHIVKIPVFRGLLSYYSVIYHKPSILNAARKGFQNSEIGMLHSDNVALSFEANGVKVVKTRALQSLVHMLNKARFDAMLIPVSEATDLSVTQAYETPQQTAVLYNPYYFIVHKDNPKLAQDLERGLHIMLKNGALDSLMESTPWMQETRAHLAEHQLVPLKLADNANIILQTNIAEGFWVQNSNELSDSLLTASN